MKRESLSLDFQKLGLISAFIAITVFLVGTTISMIVFPTYSFMEQYFSELGPRITGTYSSGETLLKAPHPEIFNVSLIITGLFLLPFFPSVYLILKPKGYIRKSIQFLIMLSGITTSIFLVGVGIFDAGMFLGPHIVSALGLYYCMIITSLLWGIGTLSLEKESLYKQLKIWIIDPVASLIAMLIGIINTGLLNFHEFFVQKFSMAFYQKMLAYVFILVFGYVAVRLFFITRNRKEHNSPNGNQIKL
ncbi:MAG: DUF998 domain-containing protein [Candidatus Heimdallarchaeota archaeon]|nr:DUF998 domain-containing protein [Candidatus Heimdallarchaeota archaeon]MCK4876167.1 DUF998 domain-containing protein [Candidatus Heimdallarchaeota archaeon]